MASWALLLSLPRLAKRLRQMGVSTVIAASLLFLLAAEASAQAPLVTIQTRVVTNNSPNPYSTLVGTATYGATGAGPGYHVVVLNRTTLALVWNRTYTLGFDLLGSMYQDISGLGNNALVIISSMGPPTSFSFQAAIFYLTNIAANLGGTGEGYLFGGGPVSRSGYSLIGVPGLGAAGGSANQVSTFADPDTNGNISGVLIPDVNGNYTFTYSQFVKVQTITGPKNDTITIGPLTSPKTTKMTSFEAPPLARGANGGFHVLIVKRATLDQIATDPTVVIWHSSYATNASDASLAASETHRMASDLNEFPNGLQTGNLIFIITSLGCNPGFNSSASVTDIVTIVGIINGNLGGAGDLSNLGSNGYYSIIGIPNATGTLSPEVRSWATPQLSGNITAVLQQNNVGVFTPVNVSSAAAVTLDLSFLPTALAPPSQWPVAANGSDAVCPAGDQQCAAYKWISWQLTCATPACTDEDIRATKYIDLTFSLSTALTSLKTLTYPGQPTVQPVGFSFSKKAFSQVQEQLETEIAFALDVQAWFTNVQDVINDLAITGDLSLQSAITTVQLDVQLPQSTTLPFNVRGVARDVLMVATVVAGAVQPELVPALSLASAGIYLEMQFNNAPSGASGNQFVTEEVNLFNQIQTAFNSAKYGNGILETIVLTDWNKLQTIGTNIENASSSSSAWFFGPTTEGDIVKAATNAYTVSFYQGLMAAKYQMVNFFGVPFSDPSSYSYNHDCQTYQGTTFCVCSGQVYSPPSGAWSNFGSGPYNISMAVSPGDGSYPSNTLTSNLFNTLHLYSEDFFFTVRGWSGIQNALPKGWSDYQNNGGTCTSLTTARRQAHGLPGALLPHRPFLPSMALAANAKKPKPKPGRGSCSPSRF